MIARPPLRIRQTPIQRQFDGIASQQPPAMRAFSPPVNVSKTPKKSKSAKRQLGF